MFVRCVCDDESPNVVAFGIAFFFLGLFSFRFLTLFLFFYILKGLSAQSKGRACFGLSEVSVLRELF